MALLSNPYTIDDFKRRLGYGARENLFLVELKFPQIITNNDLEQEFSILCQTAKMPGPRGLESITIPYQGDHFTLAGDKGAEEEISFTFKTTENHRLRSLFELWIDTIQQDISGLRVSPDVYKSPYCFISQLNKSKEVTKKVELVGAFPTKMDGIDFSLESSDIISTTVSMSIDSHRIISLI